MTASLSQSLVQSLDSTYDPNDQYYATLQANWIDKSNCCCNVAYFPDGKFTIIQHWRKNLIRPLIINIIYFITLIICLIDIYISFPSNMSFYFVFSLIIFLYLMLFISYMLIIIKGPGYVPFNWQITMKKNYSWNEEMNSIAIYEEQVLYGRLASRPPRASFSIEARRFVLRADHFCLWTNSWIGFKNHRYFILFTLWALLYCIGWFISHWYYFKIVFSHFLWSSLVSLLASLPILYAIYYSTLHLFSGLRNIYHNRTITEVYKKADYEKFDKGCCSNFEEICGIRQCCLCWIFPFIPTFNQMDGFYSEYEL